MHLVIDAKPGTTLGAALIDRRSAGRADWTRVIKRAQLAFGGFVLDCVLLNISSGGAQLYLNATTDVPDLATLRLSDGQIRAVRRRWQDGRHAGFEFVGSSAAAA